MYWADEFADQIIKSGKYKPYWVDDMKTPSGRVHIGSVRAVVSHELIFRALRDRGQEVTFSYVLDDHDPMDSLPAYLDEKKYRQHLGKPLYKIPSPEKGYNSYGHRWGQEYIEAFNVLGVHPKIIWGSQLYLSGKMNEMVKICLDKTDKIREIYRNLYGHAKPKNWHPFSVECEKCGKLSTTVVTAWDGEKVTYECRTDTVDWTEGCGHKGRISPLNGNGKLPWKIEWACKWKVIRVTIEGAGKDHMTEGGSHDVAKLICKNVINYPVPFAFSHEFFLVGGRKMSSSKGLGSSAKEVAEIIPSYLIRFMIARVRYNRAIDFDPGGMTIPDLFDGYDEAATAYWEKKDEKLARIYELSQVEGKPPTKHFLPRFRDVAQFMQDPRIDIWKKFEEIKGGLLAEGKTFSEVNVLKEREKYASIWLRNYAPEDYQLQMTEKLPAEVAGLSNEQKEFLNKTIDLIKTEKSPDELQLKLFRLAKELKLDSRNAFSSIYTAFIGKKHGPRAAWFLLRYPKKQVIERLKKAIGMKGKK